MEVVITCTKCGIPFIIEGKFLPNKENLCCPNCTTPFPQEQFEHLKKGIAHLIEAKKDVERQHQKRIDFEIRESTNRQ